MHLTGSYIGIWFTREEVETIFGLDPLADATVYMLRGKVLGESENVGLWVEVHAVVAPPEDNVFPDIPAEKPRRLIRWEFVHSAELFDTAEEMQAPADFRPLAA